MAANGLSLSAAAPATVARQAGAGRRRATAALSRRAARLPRPTIVRAYDDLGVESGNLKELQEDIDKYLKQQNQADVDAVDMEEGTVVGADVVSDEEARDLCQRVVQVLKKLQTNRRMGLSEVQLTIEIEQPEEIERNKVLDIKNVPSRAERALALTRVTEGKIPENRLALKTLCEELEAWPYLDEAVRDEGSSGVSEYEQLASGGGGWGAPKRKMGRDPNEAPTSVMDMLPEWVGYSFLYLVSAVPVIITVSVIGLLFFSSLK